MAEFSGNKIKWNCSLCTYSNYETNLKCTVCLHPRNVNSTLTIEKAAVAEFSGVSSTENLLTLCNVNNERWSCPICTYHNCLQTRKCIQCFTDRPSRYNTDLALNVCNNKTTLKQSYIMSKALNKWSCSVCTFDNWPNSVRCTMCSFEKAKNSLKNDSTCKNNQRLKIEYDLVEGLTKNFAATTFNSQVQERNKSEHYTSTLDIYLRRFAANNFLENLFFKTASVIGQGNIEGINHVIEYLINEGNIQRRFTYFETYLLNLRGFFRIHFGAGDSLIDIAKKCDFSDLVKLIKRVSSTDEKLPCILNCASRNRIYAKVAQFMAIRNGNFSVQFIAYPYNFNIFELPIIATDINIEIMNAIFKPSPTIPPIYCFADCYDILNNQHNVIVGRPTNFLMENRGGAESLCDSIFQAMFGVCDRYNLLFTALKYTLIHSSHFFKPRWRDQYTQMARDCGITLKTEDLDNYWEELLNTVTSEQYCFEPIHVFAMSHIVCRPIVVVSMENPIEIKNLQILNDEKNAQKNRQRRAHIFEGIYLPVLWNSRPVSRSPIIIAFRNGLFYAIIVSDNVYQRDQEIQRFLKICLSRQSNEDNFFRFLTMSELENPTLLSQYISINVLNSNSIAIRREQHSFLNESLLFYSNWISALYCCDVNNDGKLKMSQLERKIDVKFDQSKLNFEITDEFSIFDVKAFNFLKRLSLNKSSVLTVAETSDNLQINLNFEEEEDEDLDEELLGEIESLADSPS